MRPGSSKKRRERRALLRGSTWIRLSQHLKHRKLNLKLELKGGVERGVELKVKVKQDLEMKQEREPRKLKQKQTS